MSSGGHRTHAHKDASHSQNTHAHTLMICFCCWFLRAVKCSRNKQLRRQLQQLLKKRLKLITGIVQRAWKLLRSLLLPWQNLKRWFSRHLQNLSNISDFTHNARVLEFLPLYLTSSFEVLICYNKCACYSFQSLDYIIIKIKYYCLKDFVHILFSICFLWFSISGKATEASCWNKKFCSCYDCFRSHSPNAG